MLNWNASKVLAVLTALVLFATTGAWAEVRFRHGGTLGIRLGHRAGHHGTYGYHSYHGRAHYGYGYHGGYHGYPYGYSRPQHYSSGPLFYDDSGQPHRSLSYDGLGALDLNVRPRKAQVYLNGRYIGKAGKFDGVPRFLWVRESTYEVILYREGYRTLAREYTVEAGVITKVNERMASGQSIRPAELNTIELEGNKSG